MICLMKKSKKMCTFIFVNMQLLNMEQCQRIQNDKIVNNRQQRISENDDSD